MHWGAVCAHVYPTEGGSVQECRSPLGSYPVPKFPFWAGPADGRPFFVRDVCMYVPGEPHGIKGLSQATKDISASLFGSVALGNFPTLLQVRKSEVSSDKGSASAPQGRHEVCSERVTVVGFHVEAEQGFSASHEVSGAPERSNGSGLELE